MVQDMKDRLYGVVNRKFTRRVDIKAPCHGCPDRFVAIQNGKAVWCHGTCKRYIEYHKRCNEANKAESLATSQRGGDEYR